MRLSTVSIRRRRASRSQLLNRVVVETREPRQFLCATVNWLVTSDGPTSIAEAPEGSCVYDNWTPPPPIDPHGPRRFTASQ